MNRFGCIGKKNYNYNAIV